MRPLLVPLLVALTASPAFSQEAPQVGERPTIETHLSQREIESGKIGLRPLLAHGKKLFVSRFNALDGQGRPASTGTGEPRIPDQPNFIRTSSPDANSCADCHTTPDVGGSGGFAVNVFVLAQQFDPVIESISPTLSNERNTVGMMGAGPIEMLAREMSEDLIGIRNSAKMEAAAKQSPVTRALVTKGISFGSIRVLPDGKVDPSGIEGVDWDLIIKPFGQKGTVVSLREFSNHAMNHHHGMQSTESFGLDEDPDGDGHSNELSEGDMTAIAIWQAALGTPLPILPDHPVLRSAAERGRELFANIGCTGCHIAELELRSSEFTEPGPYNSPSSLSPGDVGQVFRFDMTREGASPRLPSNGRGGAFVQAFTDLKRHDLTDDQLNHFANEQVPQGTLNGSADPSTFTIPPQPRPTTQFLTRKLWDAGNSDPYGHRGDLTTLTEAIFYHGGEARPSRDTFLALPADDRSAVIEFLKCLQAPSENPTTRRSPRTLAKRRN